MNLDEVLVSILGIIGIAFTYWFFLMKKDQEAVASNLPDGKAGAIDIVVEGGYSPETIVLPLGKTTKINFFRKDPSSCLEEIVVSDFKIKKYLPLNKKVSIELTPQKTGEFKFSCGMNMYHGRIIVR